MLLIALAKQCVVIRIFIVDLFKSNLRLIITTVILSYGILYFFFSSKFLRHGIISAPYSYISVSISVNISIAKQITDGFPASLGGQ